MRQLLILSGKGGTGKTTVAASFIALAKARACADCDVDAPNLHFVMSDTAPASTVPFYGLDVASLDPELCNGCGLCLEHCRFGAIVHCEDGYGVNTPACEGCAVCATLCPQGAIAMVQDQAGEMTLQRDERMVFSTARLKMGKGNSGLLVTSVKKRMRDAALPGTPLAVIDGSPGIGCPVIASLNGVDMVLVVTEPTLSGISDMKRIVLTARRFGTPLAVCVNRSTVSDANTASIRQFCREQELPFAGSIPYDPQVVIAINNGRPVIEFDCPASRGIQEVFTNLITIFEKQEKRI